jgi:hypothetical protein
MAGMATTFRSSVSDPLLLMPAALVHHGVALHAGPPHDGCSSHRRAGSVAGDGDSPPAERVGRLLMVLVVLVAVAASLIAPPFALATPITLSSDPANRTPPEGSGVGLVGWSEKYYVQPAYAEGKLTLTVRFGDVGGNLVPTPPEMKVRYLIDNVPITGVVDATATVPYSVAGRSAGRHALSVEVISARQSYAGEPEPRLYEPVPVSQALNGTSSGAGLVAVVPRQYETHRMPPIADLVDVSPAHTGNMVHAWPYQAIPPLASPLPWTSYVVEPLTHTMTGLYTRIPVLMSDGGDVRVEMWTQALRDTIGQNVRSVESNPRRPGGRNDSLVSSYSTCQSHRGAILKGKPAQGWACVDPYMLFTIRADGFVTHIAGTTPTTSVGVFENGVPLDGATDLAQDPSDDRVFYVADTENQRIARVDLHYSPARVTTFAGLVGVSGTALGTDTQVRFHDPMSITFLSNGRIAVADWNNARVLIRSTSGSWSVASMAYTFQHPFVVRGTNDGRVVIYDSRTLDVLLHNPSTGSVSVVGHVGHNTRDRWTWLDVDRAGTHGRANDIFIAWSSSYVAAERWSLDGTIKIRAPQGSTFRGGGRLGKVQDPAGHYPWIIAVGQQEARLLWGGYGTIGLPVWRPQLAEEQVYADVPPGSAICTNRGQNVWRQGTLWGVSGEGSMQKWPRIRPTFELTAGGGGFSLIGRDTVDDLRLLSDAALDAWLRAGGNGSVARPELTGYDLACLRYFLRTQSLDHVEGPLPTVPKPPSSAAPVLSNVTADRLTADTVRIAWTSDVPTFGSIQVAVNLDESPYFVRAYPESGASFGTSHSVDVCCLVGGQSVGFRLLAARQDGKMSAASNWTFTMPGATVVLTVFDSVTASVTPPDDATAALTTKTQSSPAGTTVATYKVGVYDAKNVLVPGTLQTFAKAPARVTFSNIPPGKGYRVQTGQYDGRGFLVGAERTSNSFDITP